MPNSVALPGKPGSPTAQERVSWAPELLFAASIRHPSALAALRAINAWMRDTRHAELIDVPTTERSLEIFGDEKRLDTLRDSGADTLFNGRLKLSDLRCYRVPPLLVWEAQQSPYPDILIVENSSAYDSFRRFNKEAKLWRAVVYGSGAAFLRSHEGLDVVIRHCRAQRLLYFGDLDPEGVRILFKVTEARKSCGLPDIVPHPGLYRALIQRRAVRHAENGPEINSRTAEALKTLLPGEADKVLSLWRQGVVLPQEGMGYAALRGDPAAAAVRLEYGNSSGSARQIPPEQGAPPY
ncbi:MAG: Wadjet anti-phage system protein JetD domain-containing protein [Alphaproteobacteria bacterium]